jgi:hypothetical protein
VVLGVYLNVFPWYAILAALTIIPVEFALRDATGDLKHYLKLMASNMNGNILAVLLILGTLLVRGFTHTWRIKWSRHKPQSICYNVTKHNLPNNPGMLSEHSPRRRKEGYSPAFVNYSVRHSISIVFRSSPPPGEHEAVHKRCG